MLINFFTWMKFWYGFFCSIVVCQVALDSKKRVFSWGFGGYGRLGHAETKDEMVPRQIKYFETQGKGVKAVFCGSQFSIAISEFSMLRCVVCYILFFFFFYLAHSYWNNSEHMNPSFNIIGRYRILLAQIKLIPLTVEC